MADLTVRAGVTTQSPHLYVHCCTCFETSLKFGAHLSLSLNKHGQNFHAKRARIRHWLRAANAHSHRKYCTMTRNSQKKRLLKDEILHQSVYLAIYGYETYEVESSFLSHSRMPATGCKLLHSLHILPCVSATEQSS